MNMLINKYDKKKSIMIVFLTMLALVIFVGNTDNADFANLENRYLYGDWDDYSQNPGFYLVARILRGFGFSYFWFHAIEAVIGIMLLARFLKRYSNNPAITFFLYMIYPFLLDIVQIDNFLSYVIVLNGFKFLEAEDKMKTIKYILIIFLASLFHGMALIYLIFLLVKVKKVKNILLTVIFICGLLYVNIQTLPNIIAYLPFFSKYSNQLRFYLTYKSEFQNGAFLYVILSSFMAFIAIIFYRRSLKCKIISEHEFFLLKLIIISICFSFFIIIHGEFVRLIRNMWIIYYCYFCIKKSFLITIFKKTIIVLFAVLLFLHELRPGTFYYENVTLRIFKNNVFW